MKSWLVYRNVKVAAMTADYQARFGCAPHAAAVGSAEAASRIAAALQECEITLNGGCLTGEVWLAQPEETPLVTGPWIADTAPAFGDADGAWQPALMEV